MNFGGRMKAKILIAEDSLTIQRVFELAFLRSGYQVTYIDRGEDLKSMARELNPELIICDLTLPDVDGYEAVSELKKEQPLSSIPIILLAGSIASRSWTTSAGPIPWSPRSPPTEPTSWPSWCAPVAASTRPPGLTQLR